MWTILYTYGGYDGDIDRLESVYNKETDEMDYLIFGTKELAEEYFKRNGYNKDEFKIVPLKLITKENLQSVL